jgi:hypothetical protein
LSGSASTVFDSSLLLTADLAEWTIVLGDLFSFDPAINSWMEMPPAFDGNFTIARNSMGIDSIGELLYIFGGYNMVDSYGYGVYGNNGVVRSLLHPCEGRIRAQTCTRFRDCAGPSTNPRVSKFLVEISAGTFCRNRKSGE